VKILLRGFAREGHLEAHAFELFDEAPLVGVLLLALDKVIAAEFVVGLATLQDVEGDYQ
jgi:hypothetical protein